MAQRLEKMENRAIRKYGFENKRTIAVFKITEFLKKFCKRG